MRKDHKQCNIVEQLPTWVPTARGSHTLASPVAGLWPGLQSVYVLQNSTDTATDRLPVVCMCHRYDPLWVRPSRLQRRRRVQQLPRPASSSRGREHKAVVDRVSDLRRRMLLRRFGCIRPGRSLRPAQGHRRRHRLDDHRCDLAGFLILLCPHDGGPRHKWVRLHRTQKDRACADS